ncbi:MAG: sel1 repeat family protein [Glaciimonas sp.]|nr:sel1 repeat family protein [Glaciimonas sp.]
MAKREDLVIIRAARAGQGAAQLALGKRYLFGGNGLPQNFPTALHWLDRAARKQEADAWILIGSHIPLDVALGASNLRDICGWYERAFDNGVIQAGLVLAQLVLRDNDRLNANMALRDFWGKAMKALKTAAHAGIPEAQWLLAQHAAKSDATTVQLKAQTSESPANKDDVVGDEGNSGLLMASGGVDAVGTTFEWTSRAADAGVMQAQHALAEIAWEGQDWPVFLERGLPLARAVAQQYSGELAQLHAPSNTLARRLGEANLLLLTRCACVLMMTTDFGVIEVQQFLELAASADDKSAQLDLGLWYARMDSDGERIVVGAGSANYKKAIRWLTQAGERGLSEAWYALSRIYLKSEFSQRNLIDMQRHLAHAAEMGHCAAQLECGVSAWRNRREKLTNDVQAVYWLQKAAIQGDMVAQRLLAKIADHVHPMAWALTAKQQLTRELVASHPFLAARIELALLFGLSRPEALLLDVNHADCGHCLVVDIRAYYARSKRRLILIETGDERQTFNRLARMFEDVDCGPDGPEGNYRQRLYRFKTALPALGVVGKRVKEDEEIADTNV